MCVALHCAFCMFPCLCEKNESSPTRTRGIRTVLTDFDSISQLSLSANGIDASPELTHLQTQNQPSEDTHRSEMLSPAVDTLSFDFIEFENEGVDASLNVLEAMPPSAPGEV